MATRSTPDASPSLRGVPAGILVNTSTLLHMKLEPGQLATTNPLEARRPFIEQATAFSVEKCGRDPKLAHQKWTRVLHGLKSPCTLVYPELYLASMTNWRRSSGAIMDALQGYIRVPLNRDRDEWYAVHLPDASAPDYDQHVFLLVVKRYGQVVLGEDAAQLFWSHNLVILETQEPGDDEPQHAAGMAFVYSFDVGRDKDGVVRYEPAGMYLTREDDYSRRGGRRVVDDRTDGLEKSNNLELMATECARELKLPLNESRINRRTPQEQQEQRQMLRAAALAPPAIVGSETPTGSNGGPRGFVNPFARR